MTSFSERIERLIHLAGRAASLLILLIMVIVTYEVLSRYLFNAPTSWAWLINKQIFGVFVLIGGSYALIHDSHIRIEMLYEHYPPAMKTVIRWLTLLTGLFFLGCLLWKSSVMGLDAWQTKEKAPGIFKLPLYPLKLFMPVGTALFILGCIAVFSRKKQ